jgi:hypothetical protein
MGAGDVELWRHGRGIPAMMSTAAVLAQSAGRVWRVLVVAAKLRVQRGGPGVAQNVGATGGRGARRQTRFDASMPFLSRQDVAGVCWPGRCGPPFNKWRAPAGSGDQGGSERHDG